MSILDRIFETKRQEVADAKTRVPEEVLRGQAAAAPPPRGFRQALVDARKRPALIAEVKKASPSKGLIRPDMDPAGVARAYERAGAAALSVLTDESYFEGSLANLSAARGAVALPVLRKDFVFDPYQVLEARAYGADAILLIVAALEPAQVRGLRELARSYGMDALVEVHSLEEAQTALDCGCDLVGINNRNLGDFTTDLAVTEALAPLLSPHALVVGESALENVSDVNRAVSAGANAVLIGTAFCAATDVEAAVAEVMGW